MFFKSEEIPKNVVITTSSTPKKSKALSKNIEKLRNFFKVLIEDHKNPEKRTIESLEETIQRLNAKKVAIIEAAEKKEYKILDEYTDAINKSKGSLDTAVAKETKNIKLNRLNEETESKLDSIDVKIDDLQSVIDERKEEMEFELQQQVLQQQLKDEVSKMTTGPAIKLEPIPEKKLESTDSWTEKDQKNLDSFRRYVQATSGKKQKSETVTEAEVATENAEPNLEPIVESGRGESSQVTGDLNENINNLSKEFDKKIDVKKESSNIVSDTKKSEIEMADKIASIRKQLDTNLSLLLDDYIVQIDRIYREKLETNIGLMTGKTEEIINKAGEEVEKQKAEKVQIAKDRDQYKSHYEQATQMVQDRDTTIASKDAEIEQLKEQLRQAEIAKDVAEKSKETAENELRHSKMREERYKGVIDMFANQGIMQPVEQVNPTETIENAGMKI